MSTHPFPGDDLPPVRIHAHSARITIPKRIREELDLDHGEEPDKIHYDAGAREITFKF